jgi:hypothetical protein
LHGGELDFARESQDRRRGKGEGEERRRQWKNVKGVKDKEMKGYLYTDEKLHVLDVSRLELKKIHFQQYKSINLEMGYNVRQHKKISNHFLAIQLLCSLFILIVLVGK